MKKIFSVLFSTILLVLVATNSVFSQGVLIYSSSASTVAKPTNVICPNLAQEAVLGFSADSNRPFNNVDIIWEDGSTTLQVTQIDFDAKKIKRKLAWTILGKYTIKYTINYKDGSNSGLKTLDIPVYNKPNITVGRTEPKGACAPQSIKLTISSADSIPNTTFVISYGDWKLTKDSFVSSLSVNTSTSKPLSFQYDRSSKGKNYITTDGDVLCTNCFFITVKARNECGTVLTFATPVVLYGKPDPDFDTLMGVKKLQTTFKTEYNFCETGLQKFRNFTFAGAGRNTDSSDFETYETILWKVKPDVGDTVFTKQSLFPCTNSNAKCDSLVFLDFPKSSHYTITLSQTNKCGTGTKTKDLYIRPKPYVRFALRDSLYCVPANAVFENKSDTSIREFRWKFNDSDTVLVTKLAPYEQFISDKGAYPMNLTVKDKYCPNKYDSIITMDRYCQDLYVPSAFIPESFNDKFRTFRPIAMNLVSYKIEVFNLFGERLWMSSETFEGRPNDGWDGTYKDSPCPAGVYIWKIKATIKDGAYPDGSPIEREWKGTPKTTGTFTLIR